MRASDSVDGLIGSMRRACDEAVSGARTPAKFAKYHTGVVYFLGKFEAAISQERSSHEKLKDLVATFHISAEVNGGPDAVTFVFPNPNGSDEKITRSRTVVRHWSAAFEALIQHGNGMDGDLPKEAVVLHDTSPDAFKLVSDFMISGHIPEGSLQDVVPPQAAATSTAPLTTALVRTSLERLREIEAGLGLREGSLGDRHTQRSFGEHPILKLADQYGIASLVDCYFEALQKRTPMSPKNAGSYLELSLRYHCQTVENTSARMLAESPGTFTLPLEGFEFILDLLPETGRKPSPIFCLSAEAAAAVLKQDNAALENEKDILRIVNKWAKENGAKPEQIELLLDTVRVELLSFDQLTSLQESLWLIKDFEAAHTKLVKLITSTVMKKLEGPVDATNLRKRKNTVLACVNEEEQRRKQLRMVVEMSRSPPP